MKSAIIQQKNVNKRDSALTSQVRPDFHHLVSLRAAVALSTLKLLKAWLLLYDRS